jgi:hypothetical protein
MKPFHALARSRHQGACVATALGGADPLREGAVLLEFLALLAFGVVAFGLLIVAVIALPLMLVGGVLKLLVFAIVLPFRVIGALFGAVAGVTGTVFGGIAAIGSVLLTVLLAVGALLFLPLLPIFALFGLIWLFSRSARKAKA